MFNIYISSGTLNLAVVFNLWYGTNLKEDARVKSFGILNNIYFYKLTIGTQVFNFIIGAT